MVSLERQNKLICRRIFLPYDLNQVLKEKSSIYQKITKGKSVFENFMQWILRQIKFFQCTRDSIGILAMDFERIFDVPFFSFNLTPARCAKEFNKDQPSMDISQRRRHQQSSSAIELPPLQKQALQFITATKVQSCQLFSTFYKVDVVRNFDLPSMHLDWKPMYQ